ncbi:sigma-70 family RNA polymerase sigma factor [Actinophytocola glycyrrhizae]|uniref:Sigma-70 family RNA polymerase sigma factor n=1 Tax=Actinophytocola glycyrrhizae TaxID=2044873 RepID=A0ABV9S1I3_9PSEU
MSTFACNLRAGHRVVGTEPPDTTAPADAGPGERLALRAALLAVPPGQRAVLVLRYVADLSVEQVAETLGCTAGTVKSQTARGLAALRTAYHKGDVSMEMRGA